MKQALLYDPYLDTLGGGERYILTIAEILQKLDWQVTLAWKESGIIDQAKKRFGLDISQVKTNPDLFTLISQQHNLYSRWKSLKDFDLVFVVSDGSVPILFGKKTLLHYQVPFTQTNRNPLIDQAKLLSISKIVVNSNFTKKVIDKTLGTNKSVVLYPPVDVEFFKASKKKENIILNVGRFASPSHAKRQDVLIEAFRKLHKKGITDWKLILAGGYVEDDHMNYLKDQAKGLPIEFVLNPNFSELIELYEKSKIYWHAAGFEVDEEINPEAVEHFGIVTVEAMAAGCVPVVINKGGQREIVDIDSGYLCQDIDEIVENTVVLTKQPELLETYSQSCKLRSQNFSKETFSRHFLELF